MDWTVVTFVAAIVKTMIHVTTSVDCVLEDVRMGILEHAVIAVRNLHFLPKIILYTLSCLFLITMLTFMCIIACKAGSYGKNCSFQCSPNCNKTCAPIDGSCEDCKEGSKSYCSKGNYKVYWKNFICTYVLNYLSVIA